MIKKFHHEQLEHDSLSPTVTKAAGHALREFMDSPAWFRFSQQLHISRQRRSEVLLRPVGKTTHIEYAEASGWLQCLSAVEKMFNTILEEAIKAEDDTTGNA